MRIWPVLGTGEGTVRLIMSLKGDFSIDEETRKRLSASVDRLLARTEAGPAEVILVPLEKEPSSSEAISLQSAFVAWEQARHRFYWRKEDVGHAAEIIAAALYLHTRAEPLDQFPPVYDKELEGFIYKIRLSKTGEELYLPFYHDLGCFWINHPPDPNHAVFFLYLGDVRSILFRDDLGLSSARSTTLYQKFQRDYSSITGIAAGEQDAGRFFGYRYDRCTPKRFSTLADRSFNRRRKIDSRTRARILARDKSTCQLCGRKAPDVNLEVDHRVPVILGGSNDDDNLWTLCEECNRGKSAQQFFTSVEK